MNTKVTTLLAKVTAPLAVAICAMTATSANAFQTDGTLIICSIEPLTGIGTAFGAPNYNGKIIAIEEINNAGGIEIVSRLIEQDDISRCLKNSPQRQIMALTAGESVNPQLEAFL